MYLNITKKSPVLPSGMMPGIKRFPEDEIYHPGKLKPVALLCGSLILTLGSVLVIMNNPDNYRYWIGISGILLFGTGIVLSFLMLLPGLFYLHLCPKGLAFRHLWRTQFYRWTDIKEFGIYSFTSGHGLHRMVGFILTETAKVGRNRLFFRSRWMRNINTALASYDVVLGETYGWSLEKLVDHLNELKDRYSTDIDPSSDGDLLTQ